jgi:hypothetical protein
MTLRSWKRLLFRRGYMPEGDFHDVFDRIRGRLDEILRPPKDHAPWVPTILSARASTILSEGDSTAAADHDKTLREEANKRFLEIFREEAEAQWDRIIDRRMKDWFYSAILSGLVGFLLGKFL